MKTKFDTLFESVLLTEDIKVSAIHYILFEEAESFEELSESKIKAAMKKAGIHATKKKGLLDYIMKAGKHFYKLFKAALKKDKKTVVELLNKEISKEELLDFLLKLDAATLHLISGPIHFIDAVTGWHIAANIESGAESAYNMVKSAYQSLVNAVKNCNLIDTKNPEDLKLKDIKQKIGI